MLYFARPFAEGHHHRSLTGLPFTSKHFVKNGVAEFDNRRRIPFRLIDGTSASRSIESKLCSKELNSSKKASKAHRYSTNPYVIIQLISVPKRLYTARADLLNIPLHTRFTKNLKCRSRALLRASLRKKLKVHSQSPVLPRKSGASRHHDSHRVIASSCYSPSNIHIHIHPNIKSR